MNLQNAPWYQDPHIKRLFALFEQAGFALYCVGGCVRDYLMCSPIIDVDFATSARPWQIKALCQDAGIKVIPTGESHGTLTLVQDGKGYEVTTFRKDIKTDGRHATVLFSDNIAEDAARRDFRLNALYADSEGQLHDPLGGMPDALAGRVRFIGDAQERIREDYLRILRFFRFSAHYGQAQNGIDADGLAACAALHRGLEHISCERITAEMLKLLAAPNPAPALAAMRHAGVLRRVLPAADDTAMAMLVAFEPADMTPEPLRRLALLSEPKAAAQHLRLSRKQIRTLSSLYNTARAYEQPLPFGYYLGAQMGRAAWVLRAVLHQTPPTSADFEQIDRASRAICPLSASDLHPFFANAALGQALKDATERWLQKGLNPTKEALLEWVKHR